MRKRILPLLLSAVVIAALFAGMGLSTMAMVVDEEASSVPADVSTSQADTVNDDAKNGDGRGEDGSSRSEGSSSSTTDGDGVDADGATGEDTSRTVVDNTTVTTWAELDNLLNEGGASGGEVLLLGADVELEGLLKPTVDVTVDGQGLYSLYSTGDLKHFAVDGTSLTLKNLALERQELATAGGVYVSAGGVLQLDNVKVRNLQSMWDPNNQNKPLINARGVIVVEDSSLTIRGGSVVENNNTQQGVVYADNANVVLEDGVMLQNNTAEWDAGVLDVGNDSSLLIQNGVSFLNNTAGVNGGAVYAESCDSITVKNGVVFKGNSASGGGAIYVKELNTFLLENDILFENNATTAGNYSGGAIAIWDAEEVIIQNNVRFVNNTTASKGGAIFNAGSELLLQDNVLFQGNAAAGFGGAIETNGLETISEGVSHVSEGSLTIRNNVQFQGNTSLSGAAIASSHITNIGNGVIFRENVATSSGGAVHLNGTVATIEDNVLFEGNKANYGGAVYISSSDTGNAADVYLQNNMRFLNNISSFRGGAVYARGSQTSLKLDGVHLEANTAIEGGGIKLEWAAEAHILNTTLHANTGISRGGGLSADVDTKVKIQGSTFSENKALQNGENGTHFYAGNGGAIDFYGDTLEMTHASILGNEAVTYGGGLSVSYDAFLTMTACIIESNRAGTYGGGIYMAPTGELEILAGGDGEKTVLRNNYAAADGGAIGTQNESGNNIKVNYAEFSGNVAGNGLRFPVEGDEDYAVLRATHDANILNTISLSTPYTDFAYNNYDINIAKGGVWYTLTYNAAGGVGEDVLVSLRAGTTTLWNSPFMREGYEFVGWRVADNAETLAAGSQVQVTSHTTVYAQWRALAPVEPTPQAAVPLTGDSANMLVSVLAVVASLALGGGLLLIRWHHSRGR